MRRGLAKGAGPSPADAVAVLRARVAAFAYGNLTDDLCLLAARLT